MHAGLGGEVSGIVKVTLREIAHPFVGQAGPHGRWWQLFKVVVKMHEQTSRVGYIFRRWG